MSTTVWTSHGVGRYAPWEADVVLLPRSYPQDGSAIGIVYCHGAGAGALCASQPAWRPGEWAFVRGLAEHHPVVVADLGGRYTFGNPLTVQRIDEVRRYLQTVWGARAGPVAVVGASMGGLGSLNYALAHRAHVLALVGLLPACDLEALYQGGTGTYAAEIARAWEIELGDPLPEGANPVTRWAELAEVPYQAWLAGDDASIDPATVDELVGRLGANATWQDVGNLGHTQDAIAAVPVGEVLQFVASQAEAVAG